MELADWFTQSATVATFEWIDLIHVMAGIAVGFFAGLIPGIGNTIMLFMLYPFLMESSLFQMLLFYLGMASVSQFSGSVIATVFGVPGEASSLPAVREGKRLFERGQGNFAISGAAIGSVFGSFISVCVIFAVLPYVVHGLMNFYSAEIQMAILWIATCSVVFLLGRSWKENAVVFMIGAFLGLIGQHDIPFFIFGESFIPYDTFTSLYEGLPIFPVVVALYVFPTLLNTREQFKNFKYDSDTDYKDNSSFFTHIKHWWINKWASVRGSIFGAIVGLIPHISTGIASNLSYAVEKKIANKKGTYRKDGHMKSLISAETANNSCTLVLLLPLMLIGIPMTASEAILLSLIEMNSYTINWKITLENNFFERLTYWFVFINICAVILCWPMVKYVNVLKKLNMMHMLYVTSIILVGLVIYTGSVQYDTWYHFWVMVLLLPLGYILRKTETLILLIAFILQDKLLMSSVIFYNLHFG